MANKDVVLVTGATGQQGGAAIRVLAKDGRFSLRAMTRKPDSEAAKALEALGVEVIQGDLDDAASLERALTNAWGVFAVQNTWEAGVEREEAQGKRIAKIARERGVQHYVYTSVSSAHRATGIPHFDNKFRVEEVVRSLGFPSHAIIRPVFFMENLLTPSFLQGDRIVTALKPTTKLQMIAVEDIGKFAAQAFTDAKKWNGAEVDIGSDAVTMGEAAAGVSEIVGRKVTFEEIPNEVVRKASEDVALMLDWFDRVGYSAEPAALEKTWGIRPLTFREWVERQKKRT